MRCGSDRLNPYTVRLLFLSHCSRLYSPAFSLQTANNHQFLQEVDHTIQLLCFRLHNLSFLFFFLLLSSAHLPHVPSMGPTQFRYLTLLKRFQPPYLHTPSSAALYLATGISFAAA